MADQITPANAAATTTTSNPVADTTRNISQDANIATEDIPREETLRHKLNNVERYWIWKAGLRAILCVLNIVAIGCAAWILAHPTLLDSDRYLYFYPFSMSSVGAIIVLGISFIWCLVCVIIPVLLKPPRPLHPGIAVGLDLVLWLAFLVVALFAVGGLFNIAQYGSDPSELDDPNDNYSNNYSGSYYLAPNNTWVYNITSISPDYENSYYNYTTGEWEYPTADISTIVRDCTPSFQTCAEQDALVNEVWHARQKRFAIEVVVTACLWLGMIFHFALFVWACVDTHRHNRSKRISAERIVADKIIADLEKKGLVSVQNGVITPVGQPQFGQQPLPMSQPPVQTFQPGKPVAGNEVENSPRWG